MTIDFDPAHVRIAGIGIVPWTRIGPERWIPQYAVASWHGWDVTDGTDDAPPVYTLNPNSLPRLEKANSQRLIAVPEFQAMLNTKLVGYDLLTYRPVIVPPELKSHKFLMVDKSFTARYENKVTFRQLFRNTVKLPPFVVYARSELRKSQAFFEELLGGRGSFVIQDEALSGGKGTFIVTDYASYLAALHDLARRSEHKQVVISDLIANAYERSIQACVTKHGVFTGPLQRQIVRDPLLANTRSADGDKFCGGQILATDQNTPVHAQAAAVARRIGEVLQREGYRGIFGVDFLLSKGGTLYTIEMNPRITGMTPLLTALYGPGEGVPFYVLHLLELGGYDYKITDAAAEFTRDGALFVLHSLEAHDIVVQTMPASGTYKLVNGRLLRLTGSMRLENLETGAFVFQAHVRPGARVKAGGRLGAIQFDHAVIDKDTDKLYTKSVEIIAALRHHIVS